MPDDGSWTPLDDTRPEPALDTIQGQADETGLDDADFPPLDFALDDDATCPYCGEAACERACTGALLADDAGEGEA